MMCQFIKVSYGATFETRGFPVYIATYLSSYIDKSSRYAFARIDNSF